MFPSCTNWRATVYDAVSTSIANVDRWSSSVSMKRVDTVMLEECQVVGCVIAGRAAAYGVEAFRLLGYKTAAVQEQVQLVPELVPVQRAAGRCKATDSRDSSLALQAANTIKQRRTSP